MCLPGFWDFASSATRWNMHFNLPGGKYEIPLVLYDRMFDQAGQLYYPVAAPPRSPWVPEFFGNALLANGKIFPFLEVEPRKYRFRTLNAANSRFLRQSLSSGLTFQQIGTDQGLLPAPVALKLFCWLRARERISFWISAIMPVSRLSSTTASCP